MAYREFEDSSGRSWRVWDVFPSHAERRLVFDRRTGSRNGGERRQEDAPRIAIAPDLHNGWLCFETENERRRLIPAPERWDEASDDGLREMLDRATVAPQRRSADR